jgi:hypothetical protein
MTARGDRSWVGAHGLLLPLFAFKKLVIIASEKEVDLLPPGANRLGQCMISQQDYQTRREVVLTKVL